MLQMSVEPILCWEIKVKVEHNTYSEVLISLVALVSLLTCVFVSLGLGIVAGQHSTTSQSLEAVLRW